MKTPKKVHCPYCSVYNTKEKVITHIDRKHPEMIPEGYSAARVLFNAIHHKDHGICVVCKRPTDWNEKTQKYNRLCGRPECKEKLREIYKTNMLKVYGKTTLLNDPEHQEKMLKNRRISGTYIFTTGEKMTYTGSYEKKLLEFLDQVIGFDAKDILMPGPILQYDYNDKKHPWITDCLLIPYNLIIEVKDGGDNPNKKITAPYRQRQYAKEEMITNLGKYNYLRLTNNNFAQLIGVIYQLKMQMQDDSEDNKRVIIDINEETEALREMAGLKPAKQYICSICEYATDNPNRMKEHISYCHQYNPTNVRTETDLNRNYENGYNISFRSTNNNEVFCTLKISDKNKCIMETEYDEDYGIDALEYAIEYAVNNLGIEYAVLDEAKELANRVYKKKQFKKIDPVSGKPTAKFIGNKGKKKIKGQVDIIKTEAQLYETGLAAVGGPIGISHTPFVIQYNKLSPAGFVSNKTEFGVQDDIKTDNLVIRNDDGILTKVPHDFLKKTKYKVFKYRGNKKNIFKKILPRLGEAVEENFIYDAVDGKPMVSNDLSLNEDFEYIDLKSIKQSITNDAYSILAKLQSKVSKDGRPIGTIISPHESVEVRYILEDADPDIVIMQNKSGYYAINQSTLRRTNYFNKISDIVLTEDMSDKSQYTPSSISKFKFISSELSENDRLVRDWRLESNIVLLYSEEYYRTYVLLEKDYAKFMAMDPALRMDSDDESLNIFGYNNADRYNMMRNKFFTKDIEERPYYKPFYTKKTTDEDDTFILMKEEVEFVEKMFLKTIPHSKPSQLLKMDIYDMLQESNRWTDKDIILPVYDIDELKTSMSKYLTEAEEECEDVEECEEGFDKNEWIKEYSSLFFGNNSDKYRQLTEDYVNTIRRLYKKYHDSTDLDNGYTRVKLSAAMNALGWNESIEPTDINFRKRSVRIRSVFEYINRTYCFIDADYLIDSINTLKEKGVDVNLKNPKANPYTFFIFEFGNMFGDDDYYNYVQIKTISNALDDRVLAPVKILLDMDGDEIITIATNETPENVEIKARYALFNIYSNNFLIDNMIHRLYLNIDSNGTCNVITPKIKADNKMAIKLFIEKVTQLAQFTGSDQSLGGCFPAQLVFQFTEKEPNGENLPMIAQMTYLSASFNGII